MRKIIVTANITLDGVMQGMGNPEEDNSRAFNYGGWAVPHSDEVSGSVAQKDMKEPVDYLLGRKTFEIFTTYWREHADVWPGIHNGTKYILSRTLEKSDPITNGWKNIDIVKNVEDIKKLKLGEGRDLQIWGSGELVHLLLENGLIDALHLRIFPVILGGGKKLFNDRSMAKAFRLTESIVTPKGVIIANYTLAGDVATGSFGY